MKVSGVQNYGIYKLPSAQNQYSIQNPITKPFAQDVVSFKGNNDKLERIGWDSEAIYIAERSPGLMLELAEKLQNVSDKDLKEVTYVPRFLIFRDKKKSDLYYNQLKNMVDAIKRKQEKYTIRKAELETIINRDNNEYLKNVIKLYESFLDKVENEDIPRSQYPSAIIIKGKDEINAERICDRIKDDYRIKHNQCIYGKENDYHEYSDYIISSIERGETEYSNTDKYNVFKIIGFKELSENSNGKILESLMNVIKEAPEKNYTTLVTINPPKEFEEILEKNQVSVLTINCDKTDYTDEEEEYISIKQELDRLENQTKKEKEFYKYYDPNAKNDDDDRNDEPDSFDEALEEALFRL